MKPVSVQEPKPGMSPYPVSPRAGRPHSTAAGRLLAMVRRSREVADRASPITHELITGNRGPIHSYLFELAAAVGYAAVGLANLTRPADIIASTVGRIVHPFDLIWSTIYVIAGLGVAVGVLKPSLRLRAVALGALGTAITMQVIAAFTYRADLRIVFNVLFAAACMMRVSSIIRLDKRLKNLA